MSMSELFQATFAKRDHFNLSTGRKAPQGEKELLSKFPKGFKATVKSEAGICHVTIVPTKNAFCFTASEGKEQFGAIPVGQAITVTVLEDLGGIKVVSH
jgi:hypothetical protein